MKAAESFDFPELSTVDEAAAVISNRWEEWYNAKDVITERWDEVHQYKYATSTRETVNSSVGGFAYEESERNGWSHSTHIPKLTHIADLLPAQYLDGLFSTQHWLEYKGFDQESNDQELRNKLEAYVLMKWELSGAYDTFDKLVNDWVETGNAFASVAWTDDRSVDERTGKVLDGYRGPVVHRIDPRDIVFNPMATSFKRSPKIIRSVYTVGELERLMETSPSKGYLKEALDRLKQRRIVTAGMKHEDIDKHTQYSDCGFGSPSQYLRSDYVEILEFFGDITIGSQYYSNQVITIVDRTDVLRQEANTTEIYHCPWRKRTNNLWGQGPLENLVGIQYMINHRENTISDAFDEMVIPTVIKRGDVEEVGQDKFGGLLNSEYVVDSVEGDVTFTRPDAGILQAQLSTLDYENKMEVYAGVPREVGGIRSPGEKTAFEVQQLQNAAQRMFNSKLVFLQRNLLERIVNDYVKQASLNMSEADIAEAVDEELGISIFLEIVPEDFSSNGRMMPVGARHYVERSRVVQEMSQLTQALAADPEMRLHFSSVKMADMVSRSFDMEGFGIYEPYVRIVEGAEATRMTQAAQEDIQTEAGIPAGGGPINEEVGQEPQQ